MLVPSNAPAVVLTVYTKNVLPTFGNYIFSFNSLDFLTTPVSVPQVLKIILLNQ